MTITHAPQARWHRRLGRWLVTSALLLTLLLTGPTTAWAQKKKQKEEEPPTKSYVLPYMIVIMLVSVGLMTVCRPGKRKERPDEIKADEE